MPACRKEGEEPKSGLKLEEPTVFEHEESWEDTSEKSPHYVGRELPKGFDPGHVLGARLMVELISIPVLLTFAESFNSWKEIHLAALQSRIFPEMVDQKLIPALEYQTVCRQWKAKAVAEISLTSGVPVEFFTLADREANCNVNAVADFSSTGVPGVKLKAAAGVQAVPVEFCRLLVRREEHDNVNLLEDTVAEISFTQRGPVES